MASQSPFGLTLKRMPDARSASPPTVLNLTLIDPFEWAQFYAGRTLRTVPAGDPTPVPGESYRWAVLERGDTPHSRLHRLQPALNVANDGQNKAEIVYWWPKEGPVENARVLVYRQKILAENSPVNP